MKSLKRFFCFLVTFCFMLSSSSVFAEESLSTMLNSTTEVSALSVIDLKTSQSDVVIESNGYSEFVDIFSVLNDNSIVKVNPEAVWRSDNEAVAVAIAEEGRILAQGRGKTKIVVSYGGFEKIINVSVLRTVDLFKEEKTLFEIYKKNSINKAITLNSLTLDERENIRDRAIGMLSYTWTPTKDLIGWKSNYVFNKNYPYIGIPYSQTPYQKDKTGFASALNSTDFYDSLNFTLNGMQYKQPRYGNDCSGFTSFAWAISRKTTKDFYNGIKNGTYPKIGSYNSSTPTSPSASDLKESYKLMQLGDAVVYRNSANTSGHVFIISANFTAEKRVQCLEQTPPYCQITFWTYDQLANNKYMPFSKN